MNNQYEDESKGVSSWKRIRSWKTDCAPPRQVRTDKESTTTMSNKSIEFTRVESFSLNFETWYESNKGAFMKMSDAVDCWEKMVEGCDGEIQLTNNNCGDIDSVSDEFEEALDNFAIVFSCGSCDKDIIRYSKEHKESVCKVVKKKMKHFCGVCGVPNNK